ncbi:hypothetical protein PENSPDRAFT_647701 [Peniophora sp. CONT]|nr:hypothetical protein PENSPDRAFT_647701 [Peniophora sp. CONT]
MKLGEARFQHLDLRRIELNKHVFRTMSQVQRAKEWLNHWIVSERHFATEHYSIVLAPDTPGPYCISRFSTSAGFDCCPALALHVDAWPLPRAAVLGALNAAVTSERRGTAPFAGGTEGDGRLIKARMSAM